MVPKCNARLCYMYKSKSQRKREYKKRQSSPRQHPPRLRSCSPFHGSGQPPKWEWAWLGATHIQIPSWVRKQFVQGVPQQRVLESNPPQSSIPAPPRNGAHRLVFGFLVVGLGLCLIANDFTWSEPTPICSRTSCPQRSKTFKPPQGLGSGPDAT